MSILGCPRNFAGMSRTFGGVQASSKTKGPGEKGAHRNHPEILSETGDFECRFPYDSYGSPENRGVRRSVWGSVSRALRAPGPSVPRVSKRCPESVPKVSKRCPGHSADTLGTRLGHSGARARRAPETLPQTASDTPIFGDTLSDTAQDTSGPKGPNPPLGAGNVSTLRARKSNKLNFGHLFFDAKIAPKKFMWIPFLP